MAEVAEREHPRSIRPVRMILTSVVLTLGVMVVLIYITGRDCSDVSGRVVVSGSTASAASYSFFPTACRSGEREDFFGVVVRDPAGGTVVLVNQPEQEPLVKIVPPGGGPEMILRSEGCTVFKLVVRDTDTKVQNITWRTGKLRLECTLENGTSVEAQLKFAACG